MVVCEASVYGIPSFTHDTGGVKNYIGNGENGYRLPLGSISKDFADKIIELIHAESKLKYMRSKSIEMYKEKMNWNAFGLDVNNMYYRC